MQWVQDPSQSSVNNLNTVRCEASRHFRNKRRAYLKAKIEELENNSKIKNSRDLYVVRQLSLRTRHCVLAMAALDKILSMV